MTKSLLPKSNSLLMLMLTLTLMLMLDFGVRIVHMLLMSWAGEQAVVAFVRASVCHAWRLEQGLLRGLTISRPHYRPL
jgi:hypothetical protein